MSQRPVLPTAVDDEPAGQRALRVRRDRDFVHKLALVAVLVGLGALVYSLSHILLLAFAAALVATILRSLGDVISEYTPLPHSWGPAVAALLILAVVVGTGIAFGAQIETQLAQLVSQLPQAANALFERIRQSPIAGSLPWNDITSSLAGMLPAAGGLVAGAIADIVLVVIGGLFMATDPKLYGRGIVMLMPRDWRPVVADALDTSGLALRQWLRGQLILMAFVGVVTGIGLWLIGLPSYLGLALIAALSEFIPYLGPFIGAFPAILIAFGSDWQMAAWTAALFFGVQQIENYLLQPLVASRMISVPPALGLFSVLAFGTLFGFTGLLLAVPLTVVSMVLVTKLYLQPILGEDIDAPGEDEQD